MRIALVSTDVHTTPPERYGGTERVVHLLAEALASEHEVTVFAKPGSRGGHYAMREFTGWPSLGELVRFDAVLHSHSRSQKGLVLHLWRLARRTRVVFTFHAGMHYWVRPLAWTAWPRRLACITPSWPERDYALRHGLHRVHHVPNPVEPTPTFREKKERRLLFLGSLWPFKGADFALDVAREAGWPIDVLGPALDPSHFQQDLLPRLGGEARHLGEVSEAEKDAALAAASVLLVPSRWREPFGLAAAEANLRGTPCIVSPHGSLGEVVGEEGGVVRPLAVKDWVDAIPTALRLDPRRMRRRVEERFSPTRVAGEYLRVLGTLP